MQQNVWEFYKEVEYPQTRDLQGWYCIVLKLKDVPNNIFVPNLLSKLTLVIVHKKQYLLG